jgi:hypothetical protein
MIIDLFPSKTFPLPIKKSKFLQKKNQFLTINRIFVFQPPRGKCDLRANWIEIIIIFLDSEKKNSNLGRAPVTCVLQMKIDGQFFLLLLLYLFSPCNIIKEAHSFQTVKIFFFAVKNKKSSKIKIDHDSPYIPGPKWTVSVGFFFLARDMKYSGSFAGGKNVHNTYTSIALLLLLLLPFYLCVIYLQRWIAS